MRAPAGALGGRKVGRFLRKRRGHVWPARRSSPTLGTLGEVGMDREDSIPTGRWADQGPRGRVAAVGRDGVSLSIPRADGLGKKWTERTRSLPGGGRPLGPRRRVRAGDAGSGDPASVPA